MPLHPQDLVDEKGERRGVLLSVEEYRELLESAQDALDAKLIDEVKDEACVPWAEVKAKRARRRR